MKKFERIGHFDQMSKGQMAKVFGGLGLTNIPKFQTTTQWTNRESPPPFSGWDYYDDVTGIDHQWDDA